MKIDDESVAAGDKQISSSKILMLGSAFGLQVIMLLLGLWIVRSILQQLGGEPAYAADVVQRVAGGDLSLAV